jgi:dolichol-phosphate mannosyltransferase
LVYLHSLIIVILPILNEQDFVEELISRLRLSLHEQSYKLVFVDDGSTDLTLQKIEAAAAYGDIDLIARQKTIKGCARGKALLDGLRYTLDKYPSARTFIEMDTDGAHLPEEIPMGLSLIEKGADVVIGSKYLNNSRVSNRGAVRTFVSWANARIFNLLLGNNLTDYSNGYRFYNYNAAIIASSHNYKFQTPIYLGEVLAVWIKNRQLIKEFATVYNEREKGKSKVVASDIWEGIQGIFHIYNYMQH